MLRKKENLAGYAFLMPSLIGFVVLKLYPVLFALVMSFCKWDLISGYDQIEWVGLANFLDMLDDRYVGISFKNTLSYVLMVVPGQLILGLLFAIILDKCVFFKRYFRTTFFMPYIANAVAVSVVWMALFHPSQGPVNSMLRAIGVTQLPGWLSSQEWALPTVAMMSIWTGMGYCIVVDMAALQGIPDELYESAKIDGANVFQSFFHITVPLISPTTFFLMLIKIIGTFQVFGPIKLMTQGGPGRSTTVVVYQIYREAFQYYKIGYASALTLVLFVIIMLVTLLQMKLQKKWVYQY